jgi:hypothetical protein
VSTERQLLATAGSNMAAPKRSLLKGLRSIKADSKSDQQPAAPLLKGAAIISSSSSSSDWLTGSQEAQQQQAQPAAPIAAAAPVQTYGLSQPAASGSGGLPGLFVPLKPGEKTGWRARASKGNRSNNRGGEGGERQQQQQQQLPVSLTSL